MMQPREGLADKPGNVEIIVLRSINEIEPYRDLWYRLCQHRDADLEFFQFFVSTRPEASMYVLLLRTDSGEALLVGRIETTRLERRIGYFRIASPRLRMLELIHGGQFGDIDSRVAQAIMGNLRGLLKRAEADAIRLHYADVTSPLFAEFAKIPQFPLGRQPVQPVAHRWRHLNAVASSFGESVSRNERSNQRRREKRLLAEYSGDVRIERYSSIDSLSELNDAAERVAARSYQRGIGVGFARTDAIQRRLEMVARQGWLRAWVLYLGGTPAAFWIGTLREGTFLSDYLAYDSELANLAPGTYLTMKALEEMQDTPSGVRSVDFGPGEAAYKARFGTSEQTTANLYLFASTWRGLCASTIQGGANFATSAAKRALASLGALDRIKRGQRRRAAKVPDVN